VKSRFFYFQTNLSNYPFKNEINNRIFTQFLNNWYFFLFIVVFAHPVKALNYLL